MFLLLFLAKRVQGSTLMLRRRTNAGNYMSRNVFPRSISVLHVTVSLNMFWLKRILSKTPNIWSPWPPLNAAKCHGCTTAIISTLKGSTTLCAAVKFMPVAHLADTGQRDDDRKSRIFLIQVQQCHQGKELFQEAGMATLSSKLQLVQTNKLPDESSLETKPGWRCWLYSSFIPFGLVFLTHHLASLVTREPSSDTIGALILSGQQGRVECVSSNPVTLLIPQSPGSH